MSVADSTLSGVGRTVSTQRERALSDGMPTVLMMLLVGILPMCWLKVTQVGGMTLRPSHLLFLLMGVAIIPTVMGVELRSWRVQQLLVFATCYAAYLALMLFGVLRPESTGRSFAFAARLGVYFGFFLLLTELILNVSPANLTRAVYWGSLAGTVAFLLVAMMVFARLGRNLPLEYLQAVATGDVVKLRCGFYPVLLNFSGDPIAKGQEEAVTASFRHGICTSFFCYFMLILALRPLANRVLGTRVASLISRFVTWTSLFIMITSVSRSITVALVAGTLTALFLMFARGRLRPPGAVAVVTLLLAVAAGAATAAYQPSIVGKMVDAFQSRYLEFHENPRVGMFRETLVKSHDTWLWGHGIGAPISKRGQQVHNVILGALYEGGVFAMVAAFLFYVSLLLTWLSTGLQYARFGLPGRAGIAWHWLLGIPCLPLLTAMVSGASGAFRLNDWVCLSFFFGCLGVFLLPRQPAVRLESTAPFQGAEP